MCVYVCSTKMNFWVWNGSRKRVYSNVREFIPLDSYGVCWVSMYVERNELFEYEMDLEKGYIKMMECIGCPCVSNEMSFLSMKYQRIKKLDSCESVLGDSNIHCCFYPLIHVELTENRFFLCFSNKLVIARFSRTIWPIFSSFLIFWFHFA